MKKAAIKVKGADCAACAYTIEHIGRKIKGIINVKYNVNTHQISVDYSGDQSSVKKIVDIVNDLGYEARILQKELK